MRQAHRVALRPGRIRVVPGWVAGGLLAAAFLSTTMVAGSTGGAAAPTGRSIDANVAGASHAFPTPLTGSIDPVGAASVDTSGGVPHAGSEVRGRIVAMSAMEAAAVPAVASATPHSKTTSHPTAAARPKAVPRPKAAPHPTAAPVKKPAARATAAPKPKAPPPKPALAIVYRYRATGRATWGEFGGAVITRLQPGTRIRVCGRLGCWEGVSAGYGPSADGGHLVDLDAAVFRRVCGPLGAGVGSIVLSWR